jgi:Cdc6-like AAA superfamily ATPase
MALSTQSKLDLSKLSIPSEPEIRVMLDRFQEASGLTDTEVAMKVGFSRSSIAVFRAGLYNTRAKGDEANSANIRAALKRMFDENAFEQQTDLRCQGDTYRDDTYKQIRKAFYGAVDHGHAYCIDGAPGTRKSFLLKTFCRELAQVDANKNGHGRRAIYVYCAQDITPPELLRRIAQAAGLPSRGTKVQLLRKLKFFLGGRRVVLVLDEVQHLTIACIEVMRELFDEPPFFGVIFAGSHAVQDIFNDLKLEQARQRFSRTIVLNGLTRTDIEQILESEFGKKPGKDVVDDFVKNSTVQDFRRTIDAKGAPVTYISARSVWFAIDHMREGLAAKKRNATA